MPQEGRNIENLKVCWKTKTEHVITIYVYFIYLAIPKHGKYFQVCQIPSGNKNNKKQLCYTTPNEQNDFVLEIIGLETNSFSEHQTIFPRTRVILHIQL